MKSWKLALAPFICVSWIAFGAPATFDPNAYLDEIKFLASPALKGRATGTPELEKAASYIVAKFKSFTQHMQFASKASNAKIHGASGVILINDRANHRNEADKLEVFGSTAGPANAGIPFVQVEAAKVEPWFAAAGKNADTLIAEID